MEINKILILGAGTMGNGIAHTFAQCGYNVVLADISEEYLNKGLNTIKKTWKDRLRKAPYLRML